MGGAMGGATGGDTRPPAERFLTELNTLQEMGFIDREANVQALVQSNGNVDVAVSLLLERGMGN